MHQFSRFIPDADAAALRRLFMHAVGKVLNSAKREKHEQWVHADAMELAQQAIDAACNDLNLDSLLMHSSYDRADLQQLLATEVALLQAEARSFALTAEEIVAAPPGLDAVVACIKLSRARARNAASVAALRAAKQACRQFAMAVPHHDFHYQQCVFYGITNSQWVLDRGMDVIATARSVLTSAFDGIGQFRA